jgi:coenzyme PQQ biosynthesis protein PqqD
VLARNSEGSLVLLHARTGHYYTLDEVAARIWELCDGARAVDDIVAALHAEYDAPAEVLAADVDELLAELSAEGLIGDTPAAHA